MGAKLKIGGQTLNSEALLPLLARYQLLPQLGREILIDSAISDIDCTADEVAAACSQFYRQHKLTAEAERRQWLQQHNLTAEQLQERVIRDLKLNQFKQQNWGNKLESYFLQHKGKFDRVTYSLLRTQDAAVSQELYFRIQAGEQSFADLATQYSQGPEAQTGGLVGPVELNVPHPSIAKMLSNSQPGQIWPPKKVGDWIVIVRLEQFLPAQLDDTMRQRLLNEYFNTWLQEQLQQMAVISDEDSAPTATPATGRLAES